MTVTKPSRKPRKNKYTSHACTNCQKKKIRCKNNNNYNEPCERCKKDNVPCVYLPKKKRRGRRKKSELAALDYPKDSSPNEVSTTASKKGNTAHIAGLSSATAPFISSNGTTRFEMLPSGDNTTSNGKYNATQPIHARRTGAALDKLTIPSQPTGNASQNNFFNFDAENSPQFFTGPMSEDLDLFTPLEKSSRENPYLAIKDESNFTQQAKGAPQQQHTGSNKRTTPSPPGSALQQHTADTDVTLPENTNLDPDANLDDLTLTDPTTTVNPSLIHAPNGMDGNNTDTAAGLSTPTIDDSFNGTSAKPSFSQNGNDFLQVPSRRRQKTTTTTSSNPQRQQNHFIDEQSNDSSDSFSKNILDENSNGDVSPSVFLSLPSDEDRKFADVTDPSNIFNLQSPDKDPHKNRSRNSHANFFSSTDDTTTENQRNAQPMISSPSSPLTSSLQPYQSPKHYGAPQPFFSTTTSTTTGSSDKDHHSSKRSNNPFADMLHNSNLFSRQNGTSSKSKKRSGDSKKKPIHDIILRNRNMGAISSANLPAQVIHAARRGALSDLDKTIGTLPSEQQVQAIVLVQSLVDQLQRLGLTGSEPFQNTTTFEEEDVEEMNDDEAADENK